MTFDPIWLAILVALLMVGSGVIGYRMGQEDEREHAPQEENDKHCFHGFVQDVDGDACVRCGRLEKSPIHHSELIDCGDVSREGVQKVTRKIIFRSIGWLMYASMLLWPVVANFWMHGSWKVLAASYGVGMGVMLWVAGAVYLTSWSDKG